MKSSDLSSSKKKKAYCAEKSKAPSLVLEIGIYIRKKFLKESFQRVPMLVNKKGRVFAIFVLLNEVDRDKHTFFVYVLFIATSHKRFHTVYEKR